MQLVLERKHFFRISNSQQHRHLFQQLPKTARSQLIVRHAPLSILPTSGSLPFDQKQREKRWGG
jgi:hypothetical protein